LDIEKLLRHRPFVRALARRLVRDEARADDLVQETYLTALRSPPRHEGALKAWLAAVVRNLARTQNRAEWRRTKHERKQPVDGGRAEPRALPSAEEALERATWHQRLVEATMALDEPYRSTLLLRYFEELDSTEIARIQGVPAATVRTRIRRGVERLRSELDQNTPGGRSAWVPALLLLAKAPGGIATTAADGAGRSTGLSIPITAAVATAVVVVAVALWSVLPGSDSSGSDRRREGRSIGTPARAEPMAPDAPVYIPAPETGHQLEVLVLDQGRPADAANVVLGRTPRHPWSVIPSGAWRPVDRGVADRNGRVNFGGLEGGYVRIAAWRTGRARTLGYVWLPQQLPHAVVVELQPQTRHRLSVTSAASGEPIPQARVWLEEQGGGPREPGPELAQTAWDGIAELNGIGVKADLNVTVTAPGYRDARVRMPVEAIALEPMNRFVRWPLVSDVPGGTRDVVRPHGGRPAPASWSDGMLQVGPIPAADWPEHWVLLGDGRFARIEAERGMTHGEPLQFVEPVRLTVDLHDTAGQPVAGVRLKLADVATGTHLYEQRETWADDLGRSVVPVYARDPVRVLYRETTGTQWRTLRTFDPAQGDARADVRLPRARILRLRILGASEHVEEGGWALYVGREPMKPVRWQDGTWTVPLRQWSSEGRAVVHLLAMGFEPVTRTFERGEGDQEFQWPIRLLPACDLSVHVRRAYADQPFRLVLMGGASQRGPGRYALGIGPDGVARDATVPAGTHRILDLVSGESSAPFLAPAGGTVDVTFDLSDDRPVLTGRLDAPMGFAFESVRFEARPGGPVPIARDGSFVVAWPEQGGVELIVETDELVTRRTYVPNPVDDLRIALAPIASGNCLLDIEPEAVGSGATKPRVVATAPDGRVVSVEARVDGRVLRFAGLEPGRWDLMVDLPGRAPATVYRRGRATWLLNSWSRHRRWRRRATNGRCGPPEKPRSSCPASVQGRFA